MSSPLKDATYNNKRIIFLVCIVSISFSFLDAVTNNFNHKSSVILIPLCVSLFFCWFSQPDTSDDGWLVGLWLEWFCRRGGCVDILTKYEQRFLRTHVHIFCPKMFLWMSLEGFLGHPEYKNQKKMLNFTNHCSIELLRYIDLGSPCTHSLFRKSYSFKIIIVRLVATN